MQVSIIKPLAKVLNSEKAMNKKFGQRAKPLRARLAVLRSSPTLNDVPKGPIERCHELTGDRKGEFAVTIKDQWRLIFRPDLDPVPKLPDGGIDQKGVTAVLVTEVSDHYK